MNKKIILFAAVMSALFLSSLASAALGIAGPNEFSAERNSKTKAELILFSFSDDAVSKATLQVIEGENCVQVENKEITFSPAGTATAQLIIDTTDEGCKNGYENVKVKLSPASQQVSSGTVGFSSSVIKLFNVVVPATNTVAIVVAVALIIAVLVLIVVMVKVAKKKRAS